jgi:glycyl-tRNA synthetase
MSTFQKLLSVLTEFWAAHGCAIHQGHDVEVGAATFNPATFLRALGPEPYNAVYIEPSRRPQDGRYGENPNRMQVFHQMQVILKPSPLDIQDLYLKSLEAIGFDLSKHDIRFVHDDWEGPTLGAWGLGWEVWIDGMEITQFTYFQAVGGISLHPIMVEIAYGLERLSMILQNVDNVYHMQWSDTLTYGDVTHMNEVQWSHYNFTEASTQMWLQHFQDFEKEAKQLIEKKLPIPAYDFVMKASHAFNILEARGMLSVTERTGYITKIRELAKGVAECYIEARKELGYPLLKTPLAASSHKEISSHPLKRSYDPQLERDFLLEIGSEELPASFIRPGLLSLERSLIKLLKDYGISFKHLEVYGTPRRLVALIKGLKEGTEETLIEKKGPAITVAFDASGNLTPQGLGFIKTFQLAPITLQEIHTHAEAARSYFIRKIKDIDYLFVRHKEPGHCTWTLLAKQLPVLILQLHFPKKMRWADVEISYPRPLRWIVALYGKDNIPFQVGPVASSHTSYGHSQLNPASIVIKHPEDYLELLKQHKVLVDPEERKTSIQKQLHTIETTLQATALEVSKVLSEVVYLSEWPMLTYSYFDPKFLKAPEEVLISEMVSHQRYFPLKSKDKLLNAFVITADNTPSPMILRGNEKVLSARLSDGVFLFEEDVKTPLESFNKKLKHVTFQKELGSMYHKVERIVQHAEALRQMLSIGNKMTLERAALLCKADLASLLVNEFPELQGIIGKHYALYHQEDPRVAQAIQEHYLPRFEGDLLPTAPESVLLSLADKCDNLIGYFSVGLKPSSSSDPYALRRQTLGIIRILIEHKLSIDFEALLTRLSHHFSHKLSSSLIQEILQFIIPRLKTVFEEIGFKHDEIEASLHGDKVNPYDQYLRLVALSKFRETEEFMKLYEVYKRAKGQMQEEISHSFKETLLQEPAEKTLYSHLLSVRKNLLYSFEQGDYESSIKFLASFQHPLAKLFDEVKILCEDAQVRSNRLVLLKEVFELFGHLLDFSKIQEHATV